MALKIVGAGLGRTGTNSLQIALQTLLGGRCYHMAEVFGHPEHIPVWQSIVDGAPPDWDTLFDGYVAEVDWPASAFWRELMAHYPDAPVLLSSRDADSWWKSASNTIFLVGQHAGTENMIAKSHLEMVRALFAKTFVSDTNDEDAAKRAFDAHNAAVRAEVPKDRLIDWQPGDGWEPICAGLGVPVPDEPFPHLNTRADFRKMLGVD